jgi:hypothetical protein
MTYPVGSANTEQITSAITGVNVRHVANTKSQARSSPPNTSSRKSASGIMRAGGGRASIITAHYPSQPTAF